MRESIRDAAAKKAGNPPGGKSAKPPVAKTDDAAPKPRKREVPVEFDEPRTSKIRGTRGSGNGPGSYQAPFDSRGAQPRKPFPPRAPFVPSTAPYEQKAAPVRKPLAPRASFTPMPPAAPYVPKTAPKPVAETPVEVEAVVAKPIAAVEPEVAAVAPKVRKTAAAKAPVENAEVAPVVETSAEVVAKPKVSRVKKAAPEVVAEPVAVAAEVAETIEPTAPEEEVLRPGQGFEGLGLSDMMMAAVVKAGYESPTPIQAGAIPILLTGRDLIGQAQTGTGKTAAFALPAIQLVDNTDWNTQVIILAPTRELAIQVAAEIQAFAGSAGVRVTAVYGGQPIDRQFRALKNGAQIVVGTPGRVLDHMRRETLSLASVKLCILDEADEMLALGFLEEVEGILSALPDQRQTALFSATMQDRVLGLSKKYLTNPARVQIETKRRTVDTTKQTYYDVVPGKKKDALARVLDMETPGPTIVFCRTRLETEELAEALRVRGYAAESLNGDMGQTERERVLKRFKDGHADLLIATDVAARGLDIDTVTHVINYDIPWDVEQYIHRIGRTGRAGRSGDAITLVEPRQRRQLYFIEQQIGVKMTPARVPTSADIASRRRERFVEALTETLDAADYSAYLDIVSHLSDIHDPSDVAAAALKMLWKSWSTTPEEIDAAVSKQEDRTETGMVRVLIGAGRFEGLRPGDIVGVLLRELGMSGRDIGAIDILDKTALVEVPAAQVDAVVETLGNVRFRGRKIPVRVARDRRDQG
jgi:ATP-dependent RNA helicase DeaD